MHMHMHSQQSAKKLQKIGPMAAVLNWLAEAAGRD